MDATTARVLIGFLNLARDQQQDLLQEIESVRYQRKSRSFSISEAERIINVSTGPLGNTCACCGR